MMVELQLCSYRFKLLMKYLWHLIQCFMVGAVFIFINLFLVAHVMTQRVNPFYHNVMLY